MKTEVRIPKTDIVITCHNKREATAARIFVNALNLDAEAAYEGWNWALEIVGVGGSSSTEVENLGGRADMMYFMDMIPRCISTVTIAQIITELYEDLKAAGNAPAPTDEDDESEQYMDEIKADAAYCLGIEYGSDEWYALAEI